MAEAAYEQLISLPMFHGMTDQDVQDVIDSASEGDEPLPPLTRRISTHGES